MSEFADYSSVDPTLEDWATAKGLAWDREYKGYDVRSISWPMAGTESVQIWIDPPNDSSVIVNVAYNSVANDRRRVTKATYKLTDVAKGLDDALATAMKWRSEALA